MNILDLIVETQLSSECASFIAKCATGEVLDVFYGKDPHRVWDEAVGYNRSNYLGEIKSCVYCGAEKIGICADEFTETSDTNYFEVD